MENHIGSRIRAFRVAKDMKQNVFSEAAGLRQQTLSTIEAGNSEPSFPVLQKLFAAFPDLSADWLLMGEGTMFRDGKNIPVPRHRRAAVTADDLPVEALTSGTATIERAQELASNGLLREIIDTQKETIADLRGMVATLKEELGKLFGSPDAARYGQPLGAVAYGG